MLKEFPFINTSIKCFGDSFLYLRDEKGVFIRPNKRVTGMLTVLTLSYEVLFRYSSIVCLMQIPWWFFFSGCFENSWWEICQILKQGLLLLHTSPLLSLSFGPTLHGPQCRSTSGPSGTLQQNGHMPSELWFPIVSFTFILVFRDYLIFLGTFWELLI